MILSDVFERFVQQSPITVMARAVLENALAPQAVDRLFEAAAERQYTRTLLFSSVVDLMGTVVCTIRPAINAAYHAWAEAIGVSLRAVYGDKKAPKKQRHTAKRIFERLRDAYGYTGGKTIAKEAVAAWKGTHAEVFGVGEQQSRKLA